MPQKAKIVTRSNSTSTVTEDNLAKGSALSFADIDGTLINLRDQSFAVSGDTGSNDFQAGDTLTITGGTGVTTEQVGSTLTITGTSQAQGIVVEAPDSSTITVADGNTLSVAGAGGIEIETTGDTLTINGSNIDTSINIDGGTAASTYGGTTSIDGGASA